MAWFALTVRARQEKSVARTLEGKGYETFVPLHSPFSTGRRRTADVPLFSGVVFARLDAHKRLPVLTTPGVIEILGGDTPVEISENEVESLRIATLQTFEVWPFPFLQAGHTVQIADGPLSGVQGVVVHLKGSARVILSVSALQRSVMVDVGDSALATFDSFAAGASQGL